VIVRQRASLKSAHFLADGASVNSGPQPEPGTTFVYSPAGTSVNSPVEEPLFRSSTEKPPLLVSSAPSAAAPHRSQGSLGLALAVGAAVAFVGGLVWAGVVVSTGYDVGFLAWFVGMATGGTVFRLYGAPVRGVPRAMTGLMAAGAIVVGKYVIFVHEVRKTLGSILAQRGLSAGYLDSRQIHIFFHHFGTIVRPIYYLWILIALAAAVVAADGRKTLRRQRRPS
jgi:hypothetical protein